VRAKNYSYTGCDNLETMKLAVNYNNYLINIILRFSKSKTDKVLDFGAGSGTYADLLKEKGIIVECLEPDKTLQKELSRKGHIVASAYKDIDDNYDLIYALNVFEHIENDEEVFLELVKRLKKGGVLVIYVPALQTLYSSMDSLVGHYRRYNIKELNRLLGELDVSVKRIQYCDPLGALATLVYKASRNKKGTISPFSLVAYDKVIFPISKNLEPMFKKLFGKNALLVVERNG